jgi:hypothetical protein
MPHAEPNNPESPRNLAVPEAGDGFAEALQRVQAGDWNSLSDALTAVGMDATEVHGLRMALDTDRASEEGSLGAGVSIWLAGLKVACAHGLCGIDSHVLRTTVEPMLKKYLCAGRT